MRFKKPLSVCMSAAMLMAFTPATAAFAAGQDQLLGSAAQVQDQATQQQEMAGQGETLGTYAVIDKDAKTAQLVQSQVTGTEATVPATITLADGQEYNVVSIADKAFWGMQKLTSVKIASGVQSIGAKAFEECVKLKTVDIPDSVTAIGEKAFFYCTRLVDVTLPSQLKEVSKGTFFGCEKLKSVKIPASVTSIDNYAFSGCTHLAEVSGMDGLTSIGARAFKRCGSLEKFAFKDGLQSIGDRAFESSLGPKNINLPDSVTYLGEHAFYDCGGIESVSLAVKDIPKEAFSGCYGLKSVELREGVETVGRIAFSVDADGDTAGIKMTIPASLKTIDSLSFDNSSISSFEVAKGNESFTAVDGVLYTADKSTLVAYPGASKVASFTIPASTSKVGEDAFRSAEHLKSVDLGDVSELGKDAFASASLLKSVTFSKKLTSIADEAFTSTNIRTLSLPSNIKEIGESSFSSIPVKTVDLGSVEKIGHNALGNTYKLKEVTIPASVTSIAGDFASNAKVTKINVASGSTSYKAKNGLLYSADGKTLVSVPSNYNNSKEGTVAKIAKGCEVIGSNAFSNYLNSKVTIPASVTTIKSDAFDNCEMLFTNKGFTVPATVTTIEEGALGYSGSHDSSDRVSSVLIVGKRGSAAEQYAVNNDFAFATTTPKMKIAKAKLAKKGKKTTVSVTGMKNGQVKYYSSDKTVAKVSKNGRVTAVGAGKTAIVAAMGTYYKHVFVTVGGKKAAAKTNPYSSYTKLDGKKQLKAWEKKYYAANKDASFTIEDNPGINCYTSNDYVAIKCAQGDTGYTERSNETYGKDIEEYYEISTLLKWELSKFKLPVSTELYSGIGSVKAYTGAASTLGDMESSLGKTLTHPILISTAIFSSVAEGFGSGTYGTVIHIYAPKNKTLGGYLYKFSEYPDEYELLLANDAQFKVVDCGVKYAKGTSPYKGKRYNGYQRYYTLEYLGNSAS